jgi:hypothetical protein
MKKVAAIVTVMVTGMALNASAQEVIASSGAELSNANAQMSFTIGEPVIQTAENGSNILTQGYHQTKLEVLAVAELTNYDVSIYPNPTRDRIVFEMDNYTNMVTLDLLDANGRLVRSTKHYPSTGKAQIEMNDLASGVYLLNVSMQEDGHANVYRIIKQ